MAPSEDTIIKALKDGVVELYRKDPDVLTVKYVRNHVAKDLDIDPSFFLSPEWKEKSKTTIKEAVPRTPAKSRAKKRKQVESDEEDEDDDLSDESPEDSEATPPPEKKPTPKKRAAPKPKKSTKASKVQDSEAEPEEEPKKATPKRKTSTPKSKKAKAGSDVESIASSVLLSTPEVSDEEGPNKPVASKLRKNLEGRPKNKPKPRDSETEEELTPPPLSREEEAEQDKIAAKLAASKAAEKADASESEMSIVIDEGPKPKRKRKSSEKETKEPKSKKAKGESKAKTSKAVLSPQEEQIKTLQSQLVKCGIRKIWQFELKEYNDDSKAKIAHLSKMLKDAGMVGRFSDARAKEIKEMRELQADLEDVQKGEQSWGMTSGRRSRSTAVKKSMKLPSESDEEDDEVGGGQRRTMRAKTNEEESEDEEERAEKIRKARAKAGIVFSESGSDSD
ncbi:hypothetical protein HYFRA_00008581 [Hymenoscyphus fraxineus]|uniref:Transcriptional regulator n=1 Tax=Hymenoscyphus fraxineus TaxID=746836 RepID=A0A9N9PTU0_9HELO|nr:hypothetical protein HYFRA_00008581 [Hymenoscyphus fraxineus]